MTSTTIPVRNLRILIIEDLDDEAAEIQQHLHNLGFEVVARYETLSEFRIKHLNLDYDMAVVDLRLGGNENRDGVKIIQTLQKAKRFVVIHTGYENDRVFELVDRSKRTAIVSKPLLNPANLRREILMLLFNAYTQKVARQRFRLPEKTMTNTELLEQYIPPFFFKDLQINYNTITHLETGRGKDKGALFLHFLHDTVRVSDASIDGFEEKCTHGNFLRIHRSHLINTKRIRRINTKYVEIELEDHSILRLNVGITFREEVSRYKRGRES